MCLAARRNFCEALTPVCARVGAIALIAPDPTSAWRSWIADAHHGHALPSVETNKLRSRYMYVSWPAWLVHVAFLRLRYSSVPEH